MSVHILGNSSSVKNYIYNTVNSIGSTVSVSAFNLFDYLLPTYIENVERDHINPTSSTHWLITELNEGLKTITVDNPLPVELADSGTTYDTRWFAYCGPGSWVDVANVDFDTNTITYTELRNGDDPWVQHGSNVHFLCPFRSAKPNPLNVIVDADNLWADLWVLPGPSWQCEDLTYRLVVNGYNSSAPRYNTTTLYSSNDLETWSLVGSSYKYKAGVAPFDESWCVGTVNHNTHGTPIKIRDGVYEGYYMNLFQGLNVSGEMHCAAVIFDENYDIIYMPTNPLVITGYVPDATDKYNIGEGVFYRGDKLYAVVSYRDLLPDNQYKILLCELSGPVDPTVISVVEVLPDTIPNCWMSLSAPGGPALEYKGKLYFFIVGENSTGYTENTPLKNNFECGVIYENGSDYVVHKQNPFIFNAVNMTEFYNWSSPMLDSLGTFSSWLRVDDDIHMFIAAKDGTDGYRVWKYVLHLPE